MIKYLNNIIKCKIKYVLILIKIVYVYSIRKSYKNILKRNKKI